MNRLRLLIALSCCPVPIALQLLPETPPESRLAPLFHPPPQFSNDFGALRPLLRFDNGEPVNNGSDWKNRRAELLHFWTNSLGHWPPLLERPRLEIIATEMRENFAQEHVRVEIAPNRFEEGFLLSPEGNGRRPAVLVPYYEPKSSIGLNAPLRDFAYQLTKRGFVTLSIGSPGGDARTPDPGRLDWQPLSFLAYVSANCAGALANLPRVDSNRIGIVGHSYGGKWALFSMALCDRFACGAWSDPGIMFDETRPNINYWEPWYLGREAGVERRPGIITPQNPRTGAYRKLIATGHDLHEVHALLAPRPFLVSGGAEDPRERWRALNSVVAVNTLLGFTNRVAMSNRSDHTPTQESNDLIYLFFERFLGPK